MKNDLKSLVEIFDRLYSKKTYDEDDIWRVNVDECLLNNLKSIIDIIREKNDL